MYSPAHFEQDRVEAMQALIASHPLGSERAGAMATLVERGVDNVPGGPLPR